MNSKLLRTYYYLKPLIPRGLQLLVRRQAVLRKLDTCRKVWPIFEDARKPPEGWHGWPEGKQFALVLTHDVDSGKGQRKCLQLVKLEEEMGFRSSFNFVARRYVDSPELRKELVSRGFEVGLHGLYHDGKYFGNYNRFRQRAGIINYYMKQWQAVGFRCPSMHHNLEWIHDLELEYDASTFDTDPFEPQSDGMGTIFPFMVKEKTGMAKAYVELPYTLPQDFTLFILMKESTIGVWLKKLDWIAGNGGMALMVVHPDYMCFGGKPRREEYPAEFYREFLGYLTGRYGGRFWNVLPRDMAGFWAGRMNGNGGAMIDGNAPGNAEARKVR